MLALACDLRVRDVAQRFRDHGPCVDACAPRLDAKALRADARGHAERAPRRRRITRAGRLLATTLLALSAVTPAAAEHEIYYRFTVLGYVSDAHGKPVADATVELVRDKTGFTYLGASDAEGFYAVRARIGDESRGEALTVRRGRATGHITIAFDPSNHTDERGTRVDFAGERAIERAAWFRSTLLNAVGAASRH